MKDHATRVRDAAQALNDAVSAARADGYRVDGVGSLDGIAVSETAKVKLAEPAAQAEPASILVDGDKPSFRKPKL